MCLSICVYKRLKINPGILPEALIYLSHSFTLSISLSLSLSLSLPIYLSIYPYIYICIYMFIYLFFFLCTLKNICVLINICRLEATCWRLWYVSQQTIWNKQELESKYKWVRDIENFWFFIFSFMNKIFMHITLCFRWIFEPKIFAFPHGNT